MCFALAKVLSFNLDICLIASSSYCTYFFWKVLTEVTFTASVKKESQKKEFNCSVPLLTYSATVRLNAFLKKVGEKEDKLVGETGS